MFTKKVLTDDEKKLAHTLNLIEKSGTKEISEALKPKVDFSYSDERRNTRVFTEIRMDSMDPELKSFVLSALEKTNMFSVERTRDGSPYDCATFENTVKGDVSFSSSDGIKIQEQIMEGLESGISKYASEVRSELYGSGFPLRLGNPFSETKNSGVSALEKFRNKILDRDANNSPTLA